MDDRHANTNQGQAHNDLPPHDAGIPSDRTEDDQIAPTSHKHRAEYTQEHWPNRVMAIGTCVLVVITGFYASYARQQAALTSDSLRAVNDTLTETKKLTTAAKTQAEAAVTQANAATASVKSTQEANKLAEIAMRASIGSVRRDQRAWLSVSGFILNKEPEDNQTIMVKIGLANSGKTPALNVRNRTRLELGSDSSRPRWNSFRFENPAVVFPGATGFSFDSGDMVTGTGGAVLYRSKKAHVFIRAMVTYDDVFRVSHFTEICAIHTFGDLLTVFRYCPKDNNIDREYEGK